MVTAFLNRVSLLDKSLSTIPTFDFDLRDLLPFVLLDGRGIGSASLAVMAFTMVGAGWLGTESSASGSVIQPACRQGERVERLLSRRVGAGLLSDEQCSENQSHR